MRIKADDFKDLPNIPQLKEMETPLLKPINELTETSREGALEEARKVAEMLGRKIEEFPEEEMRQLPADVEELLLLAAHLSAAVEML